MLYESGNFSMFSTDLQNISDELSGTIFIKVYSALARSHDKGSK